MPIPTPERSCGADCAVGHTTVLPTGGDRRQHVQHVLVDDDAGLMTTWQRHGDGAWYAYVFWSSGDGVCNQGWVHSRRVTQIPD